MGSEMCIRDRAVQQAVGAFEYFTGRVPDADRMARHFRELTA